MGSGIQLWERSRLVDNSLGYRPRRFVCGSLLCFIVVEDEVDELQIQVYLDLSVLMSLNQIKLLDYDIFGNSQQLQVHVQISEILH